MKIALIGGGASSLACAAELLKSEKDFQLTIFEKNDRVGKKLLSTGNGRCNIFSSVKKPYVSMANDDAVEFFDFEENKNFFSSLGIEVFSDEEGRCYPLSNQASSVLDALRFSLLDERVRLRTGHEVKSLRKLKNGPFEIDGEAFDFVVLAFGGKAQVRGADPFSLLRTLPHSSTELLPALVKLVSDDPVLTSLKGVRAKAALKLFEDGNEICAEFGEVQFNGDSISGICVMQLSLPAAKAMAKGKTVHIEADFLPGLETEKAVSAMKAVRDNLPNAPAQALLSGIMNKRLAAEILKRNSIDPNGKCGGVSDGALRKTAETAKRKRIGITGTKSFSDSQVTLGGVPLSEVDLRTMGSRSTPGLFLCGELLDITGFCGGYNLAWAWSSGRKAGRAIAEKL